MVKRKAVAKKILEIHQKNVNNIFNKFIITFRLGKGFLTISPQLAQSVDTDIPKDAQINENGFLLSLLGLTYIQLFVNEIFNEF